MHRQSTPEPACKDPNPNRSVRRGHSISHDESHTINHHLYKSIEGREGRKERGKREKRREEEGGGREEEEVPYYRASLVGAV